MLTPEEKQAILEADDLMINTWWGVADYLIGVDYYADAKR